MNQGPAAVRCFRQERGSRASDCAKRRRSCCTPRGKRRRCQLRAKTKPSSRPSPTASARWTILPMPNYTALGEQVELEPSGRQQVWSELSRWKGRIKKLTTRHSWRWVESQAKQMAWANWATKADQEKRQQKTQNEQAKQNKGKKNMVQCSTLVGFFRFCCLGFCFT